MPSLPQPCSWALIRQVAKHRPSSHVMQNHRTANTCTKPAMYETLAFLFFCCVHVLQLQSDQLLSGWMQQERRGQILLGAGNFHCTRLLVRSHVIVRPGHFLLCFQVRSQLRETTQEIEHAESFPAPSRICPEVCAERWERVVH